MPNTSRKRATSYDSPRVAVDSRGIKQGKQAARKRWRPNMKTRTMPFFLDENGNAYVFTDEHGNRI